MSDLILQAPLPLRWEDSSSSLVHLILSWDTVTGLSHTPSLSTNETISGLGTLPRCLIREFQASERGKMLFSACMLPAFIFLDVSVSTILGLI